MTAEHAAGVRGEVEALAALLHQAFHEAWPGPATPLNLYCDSPIWKTQAARVATSLATAADTVLAEARRLCCGDNPAPHHAATDAHSQRMAFAEELARAVRGS